MNYATICSGIGAPEEAWKDMWRAPVFTSEIEAFPSAVLKHHYPDVPNYGDITKYKEWPDHELDVLIGGTPCQSFSVAGLRRSLDDDRGNLTLTFLRLAERYQPRFTIWENVPGVLNTSDNAFGCFLGGLVGSDKVPVPNSGQGQGWGNSGFIYGSERLAAWRVLDAQHFGVPQRRRRVFVVASPREMGFAPCQILFEPESLCVNIKTRRETGKRVARCLKGKSNPSHREDSDTLVFENHPQDSRVTECGETAPTVHSKYGTGGGNVPLVMGNAEAVAIHPHAIGRKDKAGPQAKPYRTDGKAYTHNSRGTAQAVAIQDGRGMNKGQHGLGIDEGGPSYTLDQTGAQSVSTDSIVRRLTSMECERLQGFPDRYTLIPFRGKPAADSPRYKALGNSMAVPVVRWIGKRIQLWEDLNK